MSVQDPPSWQQEVDQRAQEAAALFAAFIRTVAALRHPQTGCPWDLQQDHRSLRRFMLEEAYEAAEAMLGTDEAHILEELGDVLLQVVLNAQLAHDRGAGDIRDVVAGINSKMIRRHPHVFAAGETRLLPEDVKKAWERIKAEEKKPYEERPSIFAETRKVVPSLTQAYKIGKKARTIDFDWDHPQDVLQQFKSELTELEAELQAGDTERLRNELGDLFFSLAQLSRHLGFEPEDVAQQGNVKFLRRFAKVEELAASRGQQVAQLSRAQLEELWREAKVNSTP